ncbi:MAG: carbon-nitrogen hydrolase family protein [Parvibaculaceae bacterium]
MPTVALAQVTGKVFEPDANRRRCAGIVEDAAARGAEIVVLPELIVPGYAIERDGLTACAEPLDGPSVSSWLELSRRLGVVIAGGIAEREDGRIYNTAVVTGPDGVLLHYRKLHLFDREKTVFEPGDRGLPVADTRFGRIGCCVCYDLRFVEVVRALALQDADLILVPTAWVAGFDTQRWDSEGFCPQARGAAVQANLSQVFIACASQAGSNGILDFLGSSLIATPYGKAAEGPMGGAEQRVAIASIDLAEAKAAQARSPLVRPREDRRRDVYGLALGGRVL